MSPPGSPVDSSSAMIRSSTAPRPYSATGTPTARLSEVRSRRPRGCRRNADRSTLRPSWLTRSPSLRRCLKIAWAPTNTPNAVNSSAPTNLFSVPATPATASTIAVTPKTTATTTAATSHLRRPRAASATAPWGTSSPRRTRPSPSSVSAGCSASACRSSPAVQPPCRVPRKSSTACSIGTGDGRAPYTMVTHAPRETRTAPAVARTASAALSARLGPPKRYASS